MGNVDIVDPKLMMWSPIEACTSVRSSFNMLGFSCFESCRVSKSMGQGSLYQATM
jgi:hypothetical protein